MSGYSARKFDVNGNAGDCGNRTWITTPLQSDQMSSIIKLWNTTESLKFLCCDYIYFNCAYKTIDIYFRELHEVHICLIYNFKSLFQRMLWKPVLSWLVWRRFRMCYTVWRCSHVWSCCSTSRSPESECAFSVISVSFIAEI